MRAELLFHFIGTRVACGCQLLREGLQTLHVGGVSSTFPYVAEYGFADIAVGVSIDVSGYGQPQEPQRVEGVRSG